MKSDIKIYPIIPTELDTDVQISQYGLIDINDNEYKVFYEIINKDIYIFNNIQNYIPMKYQSIIVSEIIKIFPYYNIHNEMTDKSIDNYFDRIIMNDFDIIIHDGSIIATVSNDCNIIYKNNNLDILDADLLTEFINKTYTNTNENGYTISLSDNKYYDFPCNYIVSDINLDKLNDNNYYTICKKYSSIPENDKIIKKELEIDFDYEIDDNMIKLSSERIIQCDTIIHIYDIIKNTTKLIPVYDNINTCKSHLTTSKINMKIYKDRINVSVTLYKEINTKPMSLNDIIDELRYNLSYLRNNLIHPNQIKLYEIIPFTYIDMRLNYDGYNKHINLLLEYLLLNNIHYDKSIKDIQRIDLSTDTIFIFTDLLSIYTVNYNDINIDNLISYIEKNTKREHNEINVVSDNYIYDYNIKKSDLVCHILTNEKENIDNININDLKNNPFKISINNNNNVDKINYFEYKYIICDDKILIIVNESSISKNIIRCAQLIMSYYMDFNIEFVETENIMDNSNFTSLDLILTKDTILFLVYRE